MRIILFGSSGMLGQYIYSYLKDSYTIIPINSSIFNILTNSTLDLENLLNHHLLKNTTNDPMLIINCMGLIPQNQNKNLPQSISRKNYYKINAIFPQKLSLLANKYNMKMIHITTDCVFNGDIGNYNEDSIPDESNDYGMSKSLGEPDNCCVIRTSIIGEEVKNKKSLLEWVRENSGKTINGYANHYWNGMTCLQLAKVINEMISNKIYWYGVRHLFSPNSLSKFALIDMINEIYNLNIIVNNINCDKPIDKTLSTKYPLIFNIPSLYIQIEELYFYGIDID